MLRCGLWLVLAPAIVAFPLRQPDQVAFAYFDDFINPDCLVPGIDPSFVAFKTQLEKHVELPFPK